MNRETTQSNQEPHDVVIGAGVCGLYAALTLARAGRRVTVLEKEAFLGGLAASPVANGTPHDFGVHMLHGFDEELLADLLQLMGGASHPVALHAAIRWRGHSVHYPLRFMDLIGSLSPIELFRSISGLLIAGLRTRFSPPFTAADAEEALIELYGEPLYELFFETFTHRYWGVHPRGLSATFIKSKMPRLSAIDAIRRILRRIGLPMRQPSVESALEDETLHYSSKGAATLPESIAKEVCRLGGEILTGCELTRIEHSSGEIQGIHFRHLGEDRFILPAALISTMPVGPFSMLFHPAPPPDVCAAVGRLHHRPMAVFGILVDKPKCNEALYTYYRDRIFHRIGEPKNAGLSVKPEHATLLIVEVMCFRGDAVWVGDDSAWNQVIQEAAAEGWFQPDQILNRHHARAEHAYPVFDKGFERNLGILNEWLAGFTKVRSTGRQGGFCYPNMHKAMRMGEKAAQDW